MYHPKSIFHLRYLIVLRSRPARVQFHHGHCCLIQGPYRSEQSEWTTHRFGLVQWGLPLPSVIPFFEHNKHLHVKLTLIMLRDMLEPFCMRLPNQPTCTCRYVQMSLAYSVRVISGIYIGHGPLPCGYRGTHDTSTHRPPCTSFSFR